MAFITRNPVKYRQTLDKIQDSDPEEDDVSFNNTWNDIDCGPQFEIDEVVSQCSDEVSEYESYSDDSFEEDCEDTDEEEKYERIQLHPDVILIAPMDTVNNVTCKDYKGDDRKKQNLEIAEEESTISGFYKISNLKSSENFSLEIKVVMPMTDIPHEVLYEYYLLIQTPSGNWQRAKSDFNPEKMKTVTKLPDNITITTVVAISKGIGEKADITAEGYHFVSTKDSRINVEFPPGAVEDNTEFEFQVMSIDLERWQRYKTYNPVLFNTIINMSNILSVRYDHSSNFKKDVAVRLPLCNQTDTSQELDIVPVFVRWNGSDNIEVLDDIVSELDDDVYGTSVSHFSDAAVVQKHRKASNEDIKLAANLLSGKMDYGTILTFTYRVLDSAPSCWVELVESCYADEIAEQRKSEGLRELPYSRSPDLLMSFQENVHIALGGNIRYANGIPKAYYYLKFDRFCKRNHFKFPIEKIQSSIHFGAINYECKKSGSKYALHFDSEFRRNLLPSNQIGNVMSNINPRLHLNRQSTMLSSNHRPQNTRESISNINPQSHLRRQATMVSSRNSFSQNQRGHGMPNINPELHLRRQATMMPLSASASHSDIQQTKSDAWSETVALPKVISSQGTLREAWGQQTSNQIKNPEVAVQLPKVLTQSDTGQQALDPMFQLKSMMSLSEKYNKETAFRLAVQLDMEDSEIEFTMEKAKEKSQEPNFALLKKWLQKTRSNPGSRFEILKDAFREIGRVDFVELLDKVKKENREIRSVDK